MNCPRCQAPLREGATFCTSCGLPISTPGGAASGQSPSLAFDPTLRAGAAPGAVMPTPARPNPGAYDPTVAVRPPSQPAYPASPTPGAAPTGAFSTPYAGTPGAPYAPTVAASGPMAQPGSMPYAPTMMGSAPGSAPYGVPPSGPASMPYGSTVYGGIPSQPLIDPYTGAPLAPPPPPAPPLLPRIFGPDADALAARPVTGAQAWLLRNFPLRYAASKWFTALMGAVVALGVGLLLTLPMQAAWGSLISKIFGPSGEGKLYNALFNPQFLTFFAWEHQTTLLLHYVNSSSSSSGTTDVTYTLPTLGLLLVPALALILGGYLAASSDFHRRARFSIARGALIGPFYAIILLILAQFSSTTLNGSALNAGSGTYTFGPSVLQECLFGLLWGTLFGALGGWIQLTGRRFLSAALPTLQSLHHTRLAGALAGAGVALVCGILLFVTAEFAFFVYEATTAAGTLSQQSIINVLPGSPLNNTWSAIEFVLALGPAAAIWLFSLGSGAAITASCTESQGGFCSNLLNLSFGNASDSWGLINANHTANNNLFFLLALVPLIAYLAGGRVAARITRARQAGEAFISGAVMALPLSLLMGLAAVLVSLNETDNVTGNGAFSSATTFGPGFGSVFLAVLIAGAVVGGIGGASMVIAPNLGALPRLLLTPLRPLGALLARLLEALTARPAGQPRSEASKWLYDSALAAVFLGVIVLVLIPLAPSLATSSLPFSVLSGVSVWAATLLVGLPLLFLIGSLVTAFSTPPAVKPAIGTGAIAISAPIMAAPAQPFPQSWPAPGSQPYRPGMIAPGSQPYPSGMPVPSQPYPSGMIVPGSQPYPPGMAQPGSQTFPQSWPAPGSQPFPPRMPAPGSQPFPPGMAAPPPQPYPPGMQTPGSQPYPPGSGGSQPLNR